MGWKPYIRLVIGLSDQRCGPNRRYLAFRADLRSATPSLHRTAQLPSRITCIAEKLFFAAATDTADSLETWHDALRPNQPNSRHYEISGSLVSIGRGNEWTPGTVLKKRLSSKA